MNYILSILEIDTRNYLPKNKIIESIALQNKISKNISEIKEDIAILKMILEEMINMYQTQKPCNSSFSHRFIWVRNSKNAI